MSNFKPQDSVGQLADQAGKSADHALQVTQHALQQAANGIAHGAHGAIDSMSDTAKHGAQQISEFAQRGTDSVIQASQAVANQATRASKVAVHYIQDEPVKSMLIAAAVGASLMALVTLASRSRDRT